MIESGHVIQKGMGKGMELAHMRTAVERPLDVLLDVRLDVRAGLRPMPQGRSAPAFLAALLLILGLFLAQAVPAAAQTSGVARDGYVLGPSDTIAVVVYGQEEFNVQTRIKPDGSIVMPLIGRVQASGKDVIQLADEITRQLEGRNFLRDPIVNIEVVQYNSRYARVVGKVTAPGLVPLDRAYTIMDVLLRSGWVRDDGSRYVVLRRASDSKEVRLLTEDLAMGGEGAGIVVQPGDTLFVDVAELAFLAGAAARPGGYPVEPGMTVGRLIARAGGVGPTGSSSKFKLKRDGKETDVDESAEVRADDVITVRERLF